MPAPKLTPKQELFAQNIIQGMSQADAYRNSYNAKKMSDKTVWENASRLMNDGKVKARVKELRDQIAKTAIMTAQERLKFLTKVINGEECEVAYAQDAEGNQIEIKQPPSLKTRLNAIDIMNKMQGEYVTKVVGNMEAKLEDLL